jgi:hypothetical protein
VTDAIQPVSNALYARRGLVPATPVLAFEGRPHVASPRGLEPCTATAAEIARIDGAAYGFDRRVDHAHWARFGRGTAWTRSGDVVAWSYAFPGGAIGPVAGADAAAAAGALAAELARADGPVRVRIPGSSRAAVDVALAANLRLSPALGLLLLSGGVDAPTALAIGSFTLL